MPADVLIAAKADVRTDITAARDDAAHDDKFVEVLRRCHIPIVSTTNPAAVPYFLTNMSNR